MSERKACLLCLLSVLLATLLVGGGFLLGHGFNYFKSLVSPGSSNKVAMHKHFRSAVSLEEIRKSLRYFSSRPHIAGSPRQLELANDLARRWREAGFDRVEMPQYQVLLSFPQKDKPNLVTLLHSNGSIAYQTSAEEQVVANETLVSPFLAYAPSGTLEGELVYVNYGRLEDFARLRDNLGINITGKIAIMRMGSIYRGDKVMNAAANGAIGAILYTDPDTYAKEGQAKSDTYPFTPWLPPDGVQLGSVYSDMDTGDPLTPGLPAIPGMHRRSYKGSGLPSIPAQPISYGEAAQILSRMGGLAVPKEWRGSLNISYNLGPELTNNMRVKLEVHNKLEIKTIYNVIGTIYGQEEPDRYVLMGNHRDSWVFGAIDASTGTAVTAEISRGFGKLLKKGWRPRRTIMMCSWDAEEYGLIGSHEWVEEHHQVLRDRAVTYLNMDVAVGGNYVMQVAGSAMLKGAIMSQLRKIPEPQGSGRTLYDVMVEREPSKAEVNKPAYNGVASGSDYAPFSYFVGIPVADFTYAMGYENKSMFYPVYHSKYDTFEYMEKFGDPGFVAHKAIAQFGGSLLLSLADAPLLPLTVANYAIRMNQSFTNLRNRHLTSLTKQNITLEYLQGAVSDFQSVAKGFLATVAKARWSADWGEFRLMRRINDQLMAVEKSFIYANGLPGRPLVRHVLFAPELHNTYGTSSFPGISDAIYTASQSGKRWEDVSKQISIATQCVMAATEAIEPFRLLT
ncbi:glutamate carboxypeptidase 2 isoform X2 [Nematostella vectensis]|uniref:glutamate carboxypeptidase 2 isoform X2 n=2 Tax=Nematostella vectensis TaxID=45351 RepID=UPI002077472A|nr:glutamate carboxypeptidase 2 isoform X2 [Nematostella vectensis]XP_048578301.1 glutamate carboxypeptidase 2 isoform X2 [Nematostella vectensis]